VDRETKKGGWEDNGEGKKPNQETKQEVSGRVLKKTRGHGKRLTISATDLVK